MIYSIDNIRQDVRVVIDENRNDDSLFTEADQDTLDLDEIIVSKIEEAARVVARDAPLPLLDGGKPITSGIRIDDEGRGLIFLPDDFLRLLVFRMSDWERPVYNAITESSPEYRRQYSRYKGLRGTPQKPVVAIVMRQQGQALEFWACKSKKATLDQGRYYPLPTVDRDGGIDIAERIYRSVVYEAGALTLSTLRQTDAATVMSNIGKELLR